MSIPTLLAGRYEIQDCLGKGGMGVVYRAYDRVLEETVAIKVLRRQDGEDAAAARRFLSEIKLARRVTHRNVCRIHDYGEDQGVQYISMQYMEGEDLRTRVRRAGGLPPDEACDVALQIADGLQAIHDEGIVHRDLKTANAMVDGQGVVRLMDFGIAKAAESGESLTATGVIVGTPEYMSPEQIKGQYLDARSDVYSLGVILFELFAGRLPFRADTAVATLMKHLQEEPPLDGPTPRPIPAPLRAVIGRALAKEREGRYPSARGLAEALRQARAAPTAPATVPHVPPTAPALMPPPPPRAGTSAGQPPGRARRASAGGRWAWSLLALPLVPLVLWAGWRALDGSASASPSAPPSVAPAPSAAIVSSTPPTTLAAPPLAPARPAATPAIASGSCQEGNAADCTRMGLLYNTGRGVEKDLATAADYYERGCNGGDAQGCNNLGSLYEFGLIGIGSDPARAAELYRRACDRGDAQACGNLGVVSLAHPQAGGPGREEAIRAARQGCAAGLDRACRKLRDLGIAP